MIGCCSLWIFQGIRTPRSKNSNSYYDVQELLEKSSKVKFFQIHLESWLEGFLTALRDNPSARKEVELRFKDGESFTYAYELKPTEHDLFLYLEPVEDE